MGEGEDGTCAAVRLNTGLTVSNSTAYFLKILVNTKS